MSRPVIAFAAVSLLSLPAFAATPQQDNANIVTMQVENDAVSTLKGTSDQYYTSGLRLGWTSGTQQVPAFLSDAANKVWGDGVQRVSVSVSQSIFTPRNTQTRNPSPDDHPYAGILGVTGSLIHDTGDAQTSLSVMLGIVGPGAAGREVQNGFHDIIGDTPNKGWGTQLRNEPLFEITPQRTWRVALGSYSGVAFDALPSVRAGFGLEKNYVQAGVRFRVGQGLESDYGVARIDGYGATDVYTPTQPFVWYVFGGLDGQVVGTDVTLTGNNFHSGRSVPAKWDVGELELGAAVVYRGVRITYTQVWQTQQFSTAKSGLFNYGSLAAAVRF
ncbi:lipid A deacylase LpxR family protein [Acidisphaera sp. L21]|uniref:lipid A deacylase LpxR family protein n=1 Tax=Acidisphaera sp. L21 TaxID=1641851 RepID=UPI00131CBEA3|nr:lipid A deacylase LpxR family protein [Acidisphaera sp. L21]